MLPAGTAHFLEHKMFESEEGDAFSLYAKTGASSNAFTSFDRTGYYFSATDRIDRNLDILLGMVGHPWFTEATIAKEQGIIGQEIKMYDDSPDWRLLTGLFRCLYRSHPIRDDIAGTVESIARLTPETALPPVPKRFTRPANMVLSVAGDITLDQAVAACRRAGLDRPAAPHAVTPAPFTPEKRDPAGGNCSSTMPVNKALLCAGLPGTADPLPATPGPNILADPAARTDLRRPDRPCTANCMTKGWSTPSSTARPSRWTAPAPSWFTGESATPRQVVELLQAEIRRLRRDGVDPELFTLVKNQMYGEMLANVEGGGRCRRIPGRSAWLSGYTLAEEVQALADPDGAGCERRAAQRMLREENAAYVGDPAAGLSGAPPDQRGCCAPLRRNREELPMETIFHVQFPGLGLEFTLDRVALLLGGFNIYWYGVLIALGLILEALALGLPLCAGLRPQRRPPGGCGGGRHHHGHRLRPHRLCGHGAL